MTDGNWPFRTFITSQLWTQFKQLRIETWKSQDFNRVWTRDLAIPVRRSNQLSYETTSVAPVFQGHGFKPRWSPEFFRLLYTIAEIAFITTMIIAYLIANLQFYIWKNPLLGVHIIVTTIICKFTLSLGRLCQRIPFIFLLSTNQIIAFLLLSLSVAVVF